MGADGTGEGRRDQQRGGEEVEPSAVFSSAMNAVRSSTAPAGKTAPEKAPAKSAATIAKPKTRG